jgi:CRISPR-associated endonuclease/helicase Cas3
MRLIDESAQAPVIVKYEKGSQLIQMLEKQKPDRALYRQLQRYVVNIPIKQHLLLLQSGAIKEIHPDLYIQINLNLYNDEIGFCAEQGDIFTPDDLII